MHKLLVLISVLWSLLFAGTIGWAQSTSTNKVAEKTDWAVFIDKDPTECWIVAQPKETVNKLNGRIVAAKRGDILLFVFYRPGEKLTGQIAFTGGYPFSKSAPLSLDVDGKKYSLPTIDDKWAWAATSTDDSKIINAMKRGAMAKITGKSTRGKTTIDTFSLKGFTAAIQDAKKRCSG
jgi:invasion protein IalB